jgi:hypothetical protein
MRMIHCICCMQVDVFRSESQQFLGHFASISIEAIFVVLAAASYRKYRHRYRCSRPRRRRCHLLLRIIEPHPAPLLPVRSILPCLFCRQIQEIACVCVCVCYKRRHVTFANVSSSFFYQDGLWTPSTCLLLLYFICMGRMKPKLSRDAFGFFFEAIHFPSAWAMFRT